MEKHARNRSEHWWVTLIGSAIILVHIVGYTLHGLAS
jgi:hypothetical protein